MKLSMGPPELRAYSNNLKPSLRIDPHKTNLKEFKRMLAPYIARSGSVKINGIQIRIYTYSKHVDSRVASDGNYLPGFNYDAIGASYVTRDGETVSVNIEGGFSVEKILEYLRSIFHQTAIKVAKLKFEHGGFSVYTESEEGGMLLLQREGRKDIKVTLGSMGISDETMNEEEVKRKIAGIIDGILRMERR
ncbi:hypothetical protein JW752_05140 [Candidatus Peregrinibacteria bacterium]|nr:hypothetical protein [Candidatus Peregrinibacteria bacterium]